jgi:hypothetical protein
VHAVGVLPFGRAAGAKATVARRSEYLAQALRIGIEALVAEQKRLYGNSLFRLGLDATRTLAAVAIRVKISAWPELTHPPD